MRHCRHFALLLSGCLVACVAEKSTAPEVVGLSLVPTNPPAAVGTTVSLTALATLADGTSRLPLADENVSWSSEPASVASVSTNGTATALAPGLAIVTASLTAASGEKKSATVTLVVAAGTLRSIVVTPASFTVPLGGTRQLTATAFFSDGSTADVTNTVTWSSASSTATVTSGGLVTGAAVGSAQLVATSGAVSGTAAATVSDATVQRVVVSSASSGALPAGRTRAFTATGTDSAGVDRDLTGDPNLLWRSSDSSVAMVSNGGVARGLAAGSTNLSASYLGAGSAVTSAPVALQVGAAVVASVSISPSTATLSLGDSRQLSATATLTDGTTLDVTATTTWNSASPSVASVTPGGLVNALVVGGPISITAGTGAQGTASVTVSSAVLRSLSIGPAPSAALPLGTTHAFTATGLDSAGQPRDLTGDLALSWTSSDPAVISVSNQGLATARLVGTGNVAAIYAGAQVLASPPVAVQASDAGLVGLEVRRATSATLPIGFNERLQAWGHYTDSTVLELTADPGLTWSTADAGVATASNAAGTKGAVTGVAAGQTQVLATVGSGATAQQGSVALGVSGATLVTASVSPRPFGLRLGGTSIAFTATGFFTDGVSRDVTPQMTFVTDSPANVSLTANVASTMPLATPSASVTVTAFRGAVSANTFGTITTAPVITSLQVTFDDPFRPVGLSTQAHAMAVVSDGLQLTLQDVQGQVVWSSADATRVQVGASTGVVTGVAATTAAGVQVTATLTLPTGAVSGNATMRVTDCPVTQLTLNTSPPTAGAPPTAQVPLGTGIQLHLTGVVSSFAGCSLAGLLNNSPTDLTNAAAVSYSSSDTGVATMSASPRGHVDVSASPTGQSATITAGYSGLTSTFVVRPIAASLLSVAVLPSAVTVLRSNASQLVLIGHFSDGRDIDLTTQVSTTFSSSAPSVASMTSAGVVRALNVGTTNIRGCAFIAATNVCSDAISPAGNSVVTVTN